MSFKKLVTVENVNEMIDQVKNNTYRQRPVFTDVYIEDGSGGKENAYAGEQLKIAEESIPVRPSDPKHELFSQMRQLTREVTRASFSEERYRERLFYKQAQFMADYEDEYQETAHLSMYFPYYQLLNDDQLRTFFSWRSKVRAGNVKQTDLSYVFLYIYELINNIGVSNSMDGIGKLLVFWQAYRPYTNKLDKYLAAWVRDYYILNDCPFTFYELAMSAPILQEFYPVSADRYSLEFYDAVSLYKIKQSIFYTPETEKMINDCFAHIVFKLNDLMSKDNAKLNDLVFDKGNECRWEPFYNAIFYMKPEYWPQGKKTVKITDDCIYRYRNGRWTYTRTGQYTTSGRHLIGYIFKRMEQLLRQAVEFKYKLSASDRTVDKRQLDRLLPGTGSKGFLAEIDRAVKDYYIESKKTIVKVDESNLIKIRENALITQEKLIVAEDGGYDEAPGSSDESAVIAETAVPSAEGLPDNGMTQGPDPVKDVGAGIVREPEDAWDSFGRALEPIEKAALINILAGHSVKSLYDFAKGRGFMLEVLLDGINQKALDAVGDTILELSDEIVVFDDYKELLGKAVERE